MRLALLVLLARFGCCAAWREGEKDEGENYWHGCGGKPLYIFWDENCGSDGHHHAWIISARKPDPTRRENLFNAKEGGCFNQANLKSDSRALPGKETWGSWDGCCAKEFAGETYDVTIEEVDQDGSIKVSGLCNQEGGRDWLNQVYNVSGTTTGGRRWYTSSGVGYEYEASGLDDGAVAAFLIMGIVCAVGCFSAGIGLCCCYKLRLCCFARILGPRGGSPSYPSYPSYQSQPSVVQGTPMQYAGQYQSGQYGMYSQQQQQQPPVVVATVVGVGNQAAK